MADKRIDQLAAATSLGDSDLLVVEQESAAKKATGTVVSNYINSKFGLSGMASDISTLQTTVAGKQDALTLPLPVSQGGTGATTVGSARVSLGLGTAATANIDATLTVSGGAADAKSTGDAINDINSAIAPIFEPTAVDFSNVETINLTIIMYGTWSAAGKSSVIAIDPGVTGIRVTAVSNTVIAFLETFSTPTQGSAADFSSSHPSRISLTAGQTVFFPRVSDMVYFYSLRVNTSSADVTPQVYFEFVRTDSTLSESGVPAEAAAVGDVFGDLKSSVLVDQPHDFSNDQLYLAIILSSGKWQSQLDGLGRSSLVKIPENCVKVIASNPNSVATVIAFLKGQSYPMTGGTPEFSDNCRSRISLSSGATAEYTVDSDMRFLYVARNSVSGSNITPTIVFECIRPEKADEPLYVAFGASTTVGAVHSYTSSASDVITYSDKNYPAMVGDALGLRTVNLGHGGTGFLKRGTGYDTQNFMDAIYGADEYLQNAAIVSIVFGYGNDGVAGLPVGAWDDYYPYDEEGYHPAGDSGVDTMLSKGCTLMGALNWCIKWLQEKYPRAQLVIIFGSPSANKDRTVGKTAQAEGAGIPPYKLTVNDPYTNASGNNARIKEISIELAKLRTALNIPIIDAFFESGIPFSWYSTYAKDSDGSFSVFSTTGSAAVPTWNSHPNVDGYEIWGNYIAGLIVSQYMPNGR